MLFCNGCGWHLRHFCSGIVEEVVECIAASIGGDYLWRHCVMIHATSNI